MDVYKVRNMQFYIPPSTDKKWDNVNVVKGVVNDYTYGDIFYGTVVDIGANIGSFAILAAKKKQTQMVYAYEPSRLNYDYLVKNTELNSVDHKVKCFRKALGCCGRTKLYTDPGNCGAFSMFHKYEGEEEVECTTLRSIVKENNLNYIDFLKIDCEGCEYEMLDRDRDILEMVHNIRMEVHWNKKPSRYKNDFLEKLLISEGFQITIERAFVTTAITIWATKS